MPTPEHEFQRRYYASNADSYDDAHVHAGDEHYFALGFLLGAIDFLQATSVLEVGAGTGRGMLYLRERAAAIRTRGIEPVPALREIAYGKGIRRDELMDGDACALPFPNGAFDIVCEFGMLHHVRDHDRVVSEMLRVARKAILISDCNNFGQGAPWIRAVKQALNAARLWPIANLLKTRGKGYSITEGDGLAYSYSVFSDYDQIRSACKSVHVLNTLDAGVNPYRTAPHIALLGIK